MKKKFIDEKGIITESASRYDDIYETFINAIIEMSNYVLKTEDDKDLIFELKESEENSQSKEEKIEDDFLINQKVNLVFNKKELLEKLLRASKLEKHMNGYILENSAEFLVKAPRMPIGRLNKRYDVKDDNIEIFLDNVSDEVNLLLFLYGYYGYKEDKYIFKKNSFESKAKLLMVSNEINFSGKEVSNINGFKVLQQRRVLSVKINSINKITKSKFLDYQYAYLFNLSFSLDKTFIENEMKYHSFFVEKIQETRSVGIKKSFELDAPRKKYKKDILKYYTNAKIIDNLPSKYLSYYHILEYFFEDVHYEEMIKEVKSKISTPSFSLKNDNSVKEFIKGIEEKISRQKSEGFVFNEKNALKLTIEKYMTLDEIEKNLGSKNCEYFKNSGCEFSDTKKISFDNINTIVNRIYKTRNSLVHSKNTYINRYIPFKDENILKKEIELVKVISEILIINSAKLI